MDTLHRASRSIAPLLLIAILAFSCRKDSAGPGPTGPDGIQDSIRYVATDTLLASPASAISFSVEPVDSSLAAVLKFRKSGNAFYCTVENGQILDNSTFGYATAVEKCAEIGPDGHWSSSEGLLSSGNSSAAKFRGKQNRYLGFRFVGSGGAWHYGWVRLSCNAESTALSISDYALRTGPDSSILAGQKSLSAPCVSDFGEIAPIQDVDEIVGEYRGEPAGNCEIVVKKTVQPGYDFSVQYFPFMWPWPEIPGRIVDGKMLIPKFSYEGNIPSPGGQDRFYWGNISGTGVRYEHNGEYVVIWDIQYEKTGFLAETYYGDFWSARCQ